MAGRRAVTEGILYEDEDGEQFDINALDDDEMLALAKAYGIDAEDEDQY
jgi:hypothetical protein